MKTAIGPPTLALTLIAATSTAAADGAWIVPPKEYDHPFRAEAIVIRARDQDHVRKLCPTANFLAGFPALACAYPVSAWDCTIVIAADSVIKAAGFPPDVIMRHEIAHCNGWPGDHPGALLYMEWATDSTPAALQIDSFASAVVGKTVAEVARSLPPNVAWLFPIAAAGIGLTPESPITKQILSNPATARVLAWVAGIGRGLSEDEWRQAHADAFYAAKARGQAENAAAASQSVPNLGQAAPQPQQAQPPPSGAAPR